MKRSKTYDDGISKKIKGNGNLDELWGEDLDVKDIDDCFKLITENLASPNFTCTQRNNVSIIPSYNAFRKENLNESSTSTQIAQASTSKTVAGSFFKRHHSFDNATSSLPLEAKVKKLEETCLAKQGEVNILRSQIREVRESNNRDYVKNQTEWNEKLKEMKKKLNEATSELEFKSLEIVNLKQQFELLKLNGISRPSTSTQSRPSTSIQLTRSEAVDNKSSETVDNKSSEAVDNKSSEDGDSEDLDESYEEGDLEIWEEDEFPLEDSFPPSTFDCAHRETFMMEFEEESEEHKRKYKTAKNPNPLVNLDLQRYYSKVEELESKVTYLRSGSLLNFGYVHSDLFRMMKFHSKEFQLEENYWYFNKLVCTSEQLLDNFYQYLLTVQRGMLKFKEVKDEEKKEDPVVFDLNLSPLISNQWYYNELGISARQGIACLTEILPHCSYLRSYMLWNENLKFGEKDNDLKYLPINRKQRESNYINNHNFLQLLRLSVLIIKQLELEKYSSGFLCSVLGLINESCKLEINEETQTYLFDLSFLMFSGKSTPNTCAYSLEYARIISNKAIFVDRLCKFPENKHSCIVGPFYEQLESQIFKIRKLDLSMPSVNLINFSLNILRHDTKWVNNCGSTGCKCLISFIITTVFVMYLIMKKYRKRLYEDLIQDKFYNPNLLSKCISLLHLLTSKCHDLLAKHLDTLAQYNDIIQMTLDLQEFFTAEQRDEIATLEDLLNNEELPRVNLEKLNSMEAWTANFPIERNSIDVDPVCTDINAKILPIPPLKIDPKDPEFFMPNSRS